MSDKCYELSVRDSTEFRCGSDSSSSSGGVFIVHPTNGVLDCSYNDLKAAWENGMFVIEVIEATDSGGSHYAHRHLLEDLEEYIYPPDSESYTAQFYGNLYTATSPDEFLYLAD